MTTISSGEEGEASGSGGCNNYTVSYVGNLQLEKVMEVTETHAELPELTFGPVTSQMAECQSCLCEQHRHELKSGHHATKATNAKVAL
jgi:hypothetical protein